MARPKTLLVTSMCRSCRISYLKKSRRSFSFTATSQQEDEEPRPRGLAERFGIKYNEESPASTIQDPLSAFSDALQQPSSPATPKSMRDSMRKDLRSIQDKEDTSRTSSPYNDEPYHLNVYAHRHNTHITFTEPSRNPILSLSCGNLGLRNAQKSSYDASFQLAAFTFRKMAEKQWKLGGTNSKSSWLTMASIKKPLFSASGSGAGIEVIFRGYGPGRESFQKAILGTEGRMIKPLISKVTDGTRLKFGGCRSPQVRRLG